VSDAALTIWVAARADCRAPWRSVHAGLVRRSVVVELPNVSVTVTTMAAVWLWLSFIDSVLVNMPVTSDGVTSSPGLEFGGLIVATSEPPELGVNATVLGPSVNLPVLELIEQTVLSTVDTKFPLLCAKAGSAANNPRIAASAIVWLGGRDSNPDRRIQSPQSYR
jgi:hypothetical protein